MNRIALVLLALVALGTIAHAQGKGAAGSNAAAGAATSGASASSLAGLTYVTSTWDELTLPDESNRTVVCYKLMYSDSIASPLALQPTVIRRRCSSETDPVGKKICKKTAASTWTPCNTLDKNHPIPMGTKLVVGIDVNHVTLDINGNAIDTSSSIGRVRALNINVTTQAGSTLNPTPLRPSFNAAASTITNLGPGPYYLTWPNQLPGDVIPTLSVNAIYSPPWPGHVWEAGTYYPTGSVVINPSTPDGHYWQAITGGVSGPAWPGMTANKPEFTPDGDLKWEDLGPTAPSGLPTIAAKGLRAPSTVYEQGNYVFDPSTGHYFVVAEIGAAKQSGANPALPFRITSALTRQENAAPATVTDGKTQAWQEADPIEPWAPSAGFPARTVVSAKGHYFFTKAGGTSSADLQHWALQADGSMLDNTISWRDLGELPGWVPHHVYALGEVVYDVTTDHFFTAMFADGISGTSTPFFAISPFRNEMVEWQDAGTTLPTTAASSNDLVVQLLSLGLPQVHTLSSFNLAIGVAVSGLKTHTFGIRAPAMAGGTGTPDYTGSSRVIEPVTFLTYYFCPFDAERSFQWRDMVPGLTLGISLASPTTSFYIGGASEFLIRNVQLVYGINIAKIPILADGFSPAMTTPATRTPIAWDPFVGISFNVSGFIQAVAGNAGSSKSSSSGGGGGS
jgi:hypothetical protein